MCESVDLYMIVYVCYALFIYLCKFNVSPMQTWGGGVYNVFENKIYRKCVASDIN